MWGGLEGVGRAAWQSVPSCVSGESTGHTCFLVRQSHPCGDEPAHQPVPNPVVDWR